MSSNSRARRAALFQSLISFGSLALCACTQSPQQQASVPAAVAAVPAPDARVSDEAGKSKEIKTEVQYPELAPEFAPMLQAMHGYADAAKADLAQIVADAPPRADNAAHPVLNLDFSVRTQTRDFTSAVGSGDSDFGGAHPKPLLATFTEHVPSGKLVALGDLFTDSNAAFKALSAEARRRLEADFDVRLAQQIPDAKARAEQVKASHEWIEKGTAPGAENFESFLVDGVDGKAIGLTLMFPAYQVASYADGPQQIAVPAKVFYAQLKPEYRDAFAIDKEDMQAGEAMQPQAAAPRPAG
ncbi:MAG: DUF3298 domain-containing protein [Gammaproteobacteria bacterium]|nr:MAG: DUF3298 domain-containing protein [Gammaproteobacteria bacterium]